MEHIYTFICGFKHWHTISQHPGQTIEAAIQHWLKKFSFSLFEEFGMSREEIAIVKEEIAIARPIADDAFVSMWFVFSKLGKKEPIRDGVFRIEIVDTRLQSESTHVA